MRYDAQQITNKGITTQYSFDADYLTINSDLGIYIFKNVFFFKDEMEYDCLRLPIKDFVIIEYFHNETE